jgi:hypothetical protein
MQQPDPQIEAMKILTHQIVGAMSFIVCLCPVWNSLYSYLQTQTIAAGFLPAVEYIVLGVNMVPTIYMLLIAIACYGFYYASVSRRSYTSYQQYSEVANGYDK